MAVSTRNMKYISGLGDPYKFYPLTIDDPSRDEAGRLEYFVNSPNLKLLVQGFSLKDVLLRSGKGSLQKLSPVLVDG